MIISYEVHTVWTINCVLSRSGHTVRPSNDVPAEIVRKPPEDPQETPRGGT
jgi:hypothetical protein